MISHLDWPAETTRLMCQMPEKGIFLTGIEGSDPFVNGMRRDQFEEAGNFYANYRERLENIRGLGITWLRVGPPYSKTHLAQDKYELEWFDGVVEKCRELGITIVLDLLHFGLPEWLHEGKDVQFFQNPEFPAHFATYVEKVVRRYPDINWFTPVNEPFVAASFSSRLGMWNERQTSAEAYVACVGNIAEAAIRARHMIEKVWQEEERTGEPIFVQNESFEEAMAAEGSNKQNEAELFNKAYRFSCLDLIFAHHDDFMKEYLFSRGMTEKRYSWFMENGGTHGTVLGIDYYPNCIHIFHDDHVSHYDPTMPYELYRLTEDYWQRYPLPLLHTEVNAWPEHALSVCQNTYDELSRLRKSGYPVLGMAWYGDESQMDWHIAMEEYRLEETPVGLFRSGEAQEVAGLFSKLAKRGFPPLSFN